MRGPLIFLIAGESSGDQLGASLISSLREQGVSRFAGLGGSEMSRVGLDSIFPLTDISVMGLLPVIMVPWVPHITAKPLATGAKPAGQARFRP